MSCVYGSPEYVAAHSFTGREPTGRWIGWGEPEPQPKWLRDTPFPNCKIHHHVVDPWAQLNAAKEGMGIASLGCFLADRDSGLVRVPPATPKKGRPAWVLTHPDLITTERVRVCVRFLVEAIFKHETQIAGII